MRSRPWTGRWTGESDASALARPWYTRHSVSTEAQPRSLPVRAFWAWPLSTGLLAAVEVTVQSGRLGVDPGSIILALAAGAALGLPLGTACALTVVLAQRRGWSCRRCDRVRGWFGEATLPLLWAVVVLVAGFAAIDVVVDGLFARPIDAPSTAKQLLSGALALVTLPAVLVVWAIGGPLAAWLRGRSFTPWLRRSAVGGATILVLVRLCAGPFVLYFAGWAEVLAIAAGLLTAAMWLPAGASRTRARGLMLYGPAVFLLAGGLGGLNHVGARSRLMHDARLFPRVHDLLLGAADLDQDGDMPRWLGGGDCDDRDARVSSAQPERPGNGVDDNCRLGDAVGPSADASEPAGASEPARALAPADRPPVFLITIDTVRADHTELNGYDRATMPFLAHYATGGRSFARAYAPSNHTAFSMLGLLSGQSAEFLVQEPEVLAGGGQKFTRWLPARMADAGYHTVAVNPALVDTGELPLAELRFETVVQGPFDYAAKNRGTRGQQAVDAALALLRREGDGRPLFLWLHIPDPHARHEAHEHFPQRGDRDAYDNELRWADLQVARLLSAIHDRYGDGALVVVTSDHGEAFGERGAWGHGFSLYEFDIHVPLVVRGPGVEVGTEERPVSLVGLSSTILELVGEAPGPRPTQPSLLGDGADAPVLAGAPFFWSERRMEVALVEARWKLIHNRRRGTYLLFDLESDPHEQRDLAPSRPDELARMREALESALESLR